MKKVLVVDDEPMVLMGVHNALSRRAYSMELAVCAEEAIEMLEAGQRFDVLVCDLRMPGMDGVSLLEYVSKKYPDVIRIVLTGDGGCERALRARELSHRFLEKPYNAARLREIIGEVTAPPNSRLN